MRVSQRSFLLEGAARGGYGSMWSCRGSACHRVKSPNIPQGRRSARRAIERRGRWKRLPACIGHHRCGKLCMGEPIGQVTWMYRPYGVPTHGATPQTPWATPPALWRGAGGGAGVRTALSIQARVGERPRARHKAKTRPALSQRRTRRQERRRRSRASLGSTPGPVLQPVRPHGGAPN